VKVISTEVHGALVLEPTVHSDSRGHFFETYSEIAMAEVGITDKFLQDGHLYSNHNVLRGLHYQVKHPQGKLIRVVAGEIYDVAVDLRRSSPTFAAWTANRISADNKRSVWAPPGCAHGFLVLSQTDPKPKNRTKRN
jgi:dTDP-4-dehydrorhamnose 3,5-epimerase